MSTVRRTAILIILVAAAATGFAFATGAAFVGGPADTIADDDLAIQPADGPNGQYAYLNSDDKITVDISASNPNLPPDFKGVNPDTLAAAEGVFTITYTGGEYAHVWIEHEGENVTFLSDGESFEGESNNVTLAPNQTVTVGLDIDAQGSPAGTRLGADEFSIEASIAEPDDAEAMTAGASTQQIGGGGPTTTVKAPGDDRREFIGSDIGYGSRVQFLADGMQLNGTNVTLEGIDLEGVQTERVELRAEGNATPMNNGSALTASTTPRAVAYLDVEHDFDAEEVERMTIRFSIDAEYLNKTGIDPTDVTLYRQTDAGDWEEKPAQVVDEDVVQVMGLSEDRVHFSATTTNFSTFAVAERVPRYDVTEATVTPEAIESGETATVRATLQNGGGAAGNQTVALTANGDTVATGTLALDSSETATVALSETFATAGAYDLAVDGAPVGTLTVGDPAGGDSSGSTGAASAPGETDTTPATEGPTEEPSGIGLERLGGLLAVFLLVVAGIALVRRMPRQ